MIRSKKKGRLPKKVLFLFLLFFKMEKKKRLTEREKNGNLNNDICSGDFGFF